VFRSLAQNGAVFSTTLEAGYELAAPADLSRTVGTQTAFVVKTASLIASCSPTPIRSR
jgi:hypothetical protein